MTRLAVRLFVALFTGFVALHAPTASAQEQPAPITLTFVNELAVAVNVDKVGRDGRSTPVGVLQPNETRVEQTVAGQEWYFSWNGGGLRERPMQSREIRLDTTPVKLMMDNRQPVPIAVTWIDPAGKAHNYGVLLPGEIRVQGTFPGHKWGFDSGLGVRDELVAKIDPAGPTTYVVFNKVFNMGIENKSAGTMNVYRGAGAGKVLVATLDAGESVYVPWAPGDTVRFEGVGAVSARQITSAGSVVYDARGITFTPYTY